MLRAQVSIRSAVHTPLPRALDWSSVADCRASRQNRSELIDRAAELAEQDRRRNSSLTLPGVQPRTRFWIAPVFTVSAKAYRQFLARPGAPPKPNKRLLKSMQTPSPWE